MSEKRDRDRVCLLSEENTDDCESEEPSCKRNAHLKELVSIIMPVHNAAKYLNDSISSVLAQSYRPLELVCFDDCSTDESASVLEKARGNLTAKGIALVLGRSTRPAPGGPGFGRNQAVTLSSGVYLCHLDADDVMAPERVHKQYELALLRGDNCLVGCNFNRIPVDSTPYYTNWLNQMSDHDLMLQQYRECTIICPSWFMHRNVYNNVMQKAGREGGAFVEKQIGLSRVPEDTYFFMDHLEYGGELSKVHEELVSYRYAAGSWALGTPQHDLNTVRRGYIERRVLSLPEWSSFTVWGYGKDGRKFVNTLSKEIAEKVTAFCDVDPGKVGMTYYIRSCKKHIPVVHFMDATPPIIICVASKRTGGELEENIKKLGIVEGIDYYHFS